jgi:putative tryptophan/tyrosine transport system substrate-binding protein
MQFDQLKRREFISLLSGAAAWPLAARAQQPDRLRRIGVLSGGEIADPLSDPLLVAFIERLKQLGWTNGHNVQIDFRWAGGDTAKFAVLAKELIEFKPDVILAQGNSAVTAVRQASKDVPIVFTNVSDPIGRGFVAMLARPGGNTTGFSSFEASMGGKWLEKLKEIAPKLTRAALLFNPATAPHIAAGFYLRAAEDAGHRSAVQVLSTPVRDAAEMERVIGKIASQPNAGVIVLPDGFTLANPDLTVALVARFELPAIYAFRSFAARGGLLSYGIKVEDQFIGAASYVDRILNGAKPSELPVQFPSRFELTVNLRTAKVLGLDVPAQLQQLADEVIE